MKNLLCLLFGHEYKFVETKEHSYNGAFESSLIGFAFGVIWPIFAPIWLIGLAIRKIADILE